mmetsp:Transcript_55192/g.151927  ORF Transcript_55192/g.151927 Transcript_55192/m.151927 type:complete len:215 (+) Transcript_55192:538-1182(+)
MFLNSVGISPSWLCEMSSSSREVMCPISGGTVLSMLPLSHSRLRPVQFPIVGGSSTSLFFLRLTLSTSGHSPHESGNFTSWLFATENSLICGHAPNRSGSAEIWLSSSLRLSRFVRFTASSDSGPCKKFDERSSDLRLSSAVTMPKTWNELKSWLRLRLSESSLDSSGLCASSSGSVLMRMPLSERAKLSLCAAFRIDQYTTSMLISSALSALV